MSSNKAIVNREKGFNHNNNKDKKQKDAESSLSSSSICSSSSNSNSSEKVRKKVKDSKRREYDSKVNTKPRKYSKSRTNSKHRSHKKDNKISRDKYARKSRSRSKDRRVKRDNTTYKRTERSSGKKYVRHPRSRSKEGQKAAAKAIVIEIKDPNQENLVKTNETINQNNKDEVDQKATISKGRGINFHYKNNNLLGWENDDYQIANKRLYETGIKIKANFYRKSKFLKQKALEKEVMLSSKVSI